MSTITDKKNLSDFKKNLRYSKYFNLFDPFVNRPDKKFLIYTRGRTGSTVLTDLLNSHPDMYCDYEIFDTVKGVSKVKYPLAYINSCSKRATLNKKSVYGFKVKIEQLRDEHKYKEIDRLLELFNHKGWKIIYLKRSNIFKHTISGLISNHTKIFHVRKDNKFEHEKINIDYQHLLDVMNYFEGLDSLEEKSLKLVPYLEINYEEDLMDNSRHQSTSDRIFNYLELKSSSVNTKLKKIIPENLENIILNYEEVYRFINKTKFSKYLD